MSHDRRLDDVEDDDDERDCSKTLAFVAVALLLTGAAFVSTPRPLDAERGVQRPGAAVLPRLQGPARLHRPGGRRLRPGDGHRLAVQGDVQGRQVGDPVALRLPGRRQGPAGQDRRRRHGPDQGHDPLRPRRGPGGAGRDRPARRQGRPASRGAASGSRSATPRRRSWPTSSSARRSRTAPASDYVRVPGQKRTYGVNVKVDLSTRFADWIETNLLKLDAGQVRKVVFDNHKVDPEQGRSSRATSLDDRAQGLERPLDPRRRPARPGQELEHREAHGADHAPWPTSRSSASGPSPPGLTATSSERRSEVKLTTAGRSSRSRARAST